MSLRQKIRSYGYFESFYFAALCSLIVGISLYFPYMQILPFVICPLIYALICIWRSKRAMFMMALLNYVLLIFFTQSINIANVCMISYAFVGIVLGSVLRHRFNYKITFIFVSFAYLLSGMFFIAYMNGLLEQNYIQITLIDPLNANFKQIEKILLDNIEMLINMKALDSGDISPDTLKKQISEFKELIILHIPGFMVASSALLGYLIVSLTGYLMQKIGYNYKYLTSFDRLKLPKGSIYTLFFIMISPIFISDVLVLAIFSNIEFALTAVSVVCGLSFVDFHLKRRSIHVVIRILLYIFIFGFGSIVFGMFIPMLHPANVLFLIGAMDALYDFRKLTSREWLV